MGSKMRFTLKCLLENKLRFILTVSGIAAAVASVLLIRSIGNFGTRAVRSEMDSLGMNGLIVTADSGSINGDEIDKMNRVGGVSCSAPVTIDAAKVCTEFENASAMIWGIDENAADVVSFDLLYGRFIDKGDIAAGRRVCIVDQTLANELYGGENAVGRSIELIFGSSSEKFSVVGVVKTGKGIMQSLMGSYFPAFLYTPYTAVHSSPSFSQVFIKTDGASSEQVADSIGNALGADIKVTDLASQKGVLTSMLNIITLVLTVIGGISLFVSGIGIMNIMLISVNERTKEIGIKKSIGASNGDIMADFLIESVIIASVGTAVGIFIAVFAAAATNIFFGIGIRVSLSSAVAAIAGAAALGMLFGVFPAYKAARMKPVEALRR
ncbi:MAG: ABC transporter permease [Clostridia bacterium]|nr:ABC transporter permease [Clostridia bacterium]